MKSYSAFYVMRKNDVTRKTIEFDNFTNIV